MRVPHEPSMYPGCLRPWGGERIERGGCPSPLETHSPQRNADLKGGSGDGGRVPRPSATLPHPSLLQHPHHIPPQHLRLHLIAQIRRLDHRNHRRRPVTYPLRARPIGRARSPDAPRSVPVGRRRDSERRAGALGALAACPPQAGVSPAPAVSLPDMAVSGTVPGVSGVRSRNLTSSVGVQRGALPFSASAGMTIPAPPTALIPGPAPRPHPSASDKTTASAAGTRGGRGGRRPSPPQNPTPSPPLS